MFGSIKALPLLIAVSAATLYTCQGQGHDRGKGLHRPSKIDSVAIRADARDSLKVWDVTDSLRDPKARIPVVSTQIFREMEKDYTQWRMTNPDFVRTADSLGVQQISKEDFDGNGLTDMLLPAGGQPLMILDDGDNQYRTLPLTAGRAGFDATYPVIHRTGSDLEILCYYVPWYRCGDPKNMRLPFDGRGNPLMIVDTLVYYKGDFIEKNAHPTAHRIEHIHFNAACSYGPCLPFDLFIDSIDKAIYVPERRNEHSYWRDTLTATIDKRSMEDIWSTLRYINFPQLSDEYVVNGADNPVCSTTIIHDGRKTKTINDYGMVGTHGLALLYVQLFDLISSQHWIKIGESNHR